MCFLCFSNGCRYKLLQSIHYLDMVSVDVGIFNHVILTNLLSSGYGGGEAAAWSTYCSGARMGSWFYSPNSASSHSCHVSGLVFF